MSVELAQRRLVRVPALAALLVGKFGVAIPGLYQPSQASGAAWSDPPDDVARKLPRGADLILNWMELGHANSSADPFEVWEPDLVPPQLRCPRDE